MLLNIKYRPVFSMFSFHFERQTLILIRLHFTPYFHNKVSILKMKQQQHDIILTLEVGWLHLDML